MVTSLVALLRSLPSSAQRHRLVAGAACALIFQDHFERCELGFAGATGVSLRCGSTTKELSGLPAALRAAEPNDKMLLSASSSV